MRCLSRVIIRARMTWKSFSLYITKLSTYPRSLFFPYKFFSSTCYTCIQCQTSTMTIVASLHLWGTTWWPNVAWKSAGRPYQLRQETYLHGAVKVWWKALQSFWECSSTCYASIQCQTTTIAAPTWWHITIRCANITWKLAGNPIFNQSQGKKPTYMGL